MLPTFQTFSHRSSFAIASGSSEAWLVLGLLLVLVLLLLNSIIPGVPATS